jgi:hypothetical protein
MVDVLPQASIDLPIYCLAGTCFAQSRICPGGTCGSGSIYCFGSDFTRWWDKLSPIIYERTSPVIYGQFSAQELAALKADLKQALIDVETQENVIAAGMKPQTLEEAETLEKKLTDALHEIRHLKGELRHKT